MDPNTVILITGIFATVGGIIVALINNVKNVVTALRDENKVDHGSVTGVLKDMSKKIDKVEIAIERIQENTNHIDQKIDYVNQKTDRLNEKIDSHTERHSENLM